MRVKNLIRFGKNDEFERPKTEWPSRSSPCLAQGGGAGQVGDRKSGKQGSVVDALKLEWDRPKKWTLGAGNTTSRTVSPYHRKKAEFTTQTGGLGEASEEKNQKKSQIRHVTVRREKQTYELPP